MQIIKDVSLLFLSYICVIPSIFASSSDAVQEESFFRATRAQPYHLSVGAVLFNQEGHIACHHFKEIFGHKEVYILMRETMENDETPFMTLHRGLKEEFGAVAKPVAFLGSLSGQHPYPNLSFDKTTLYIACQLIQWNPKDRDPRDSEASSSIEWLEPKALIALMEQQGIRFPSLTDINESQMVIRALPYIKRHVKSA